MYQLVVLKLERHAQHLARGRPKRHDGREAFEAICPAHDDHRRSLGVSVGHEVPVLLYCQAGCDPKDVVEALGISWREFNAAGRWYRDVGQRKEGSLMAKFRYDVSNVDPTPIALPAPRVPDRGAPPVLGQEAGLRPRG